MVATIKTIQSSSSASNYFSKEDDYYSKDTLEGSYSEWFGNGAQSLSLEGKVEGKDLKRLLDGTIDSETQLGKKVDGKFVHSPGWDLTFQAPKSVSIAALVFDDKSVLEAHQNAVKTALAHLEKEILNTRSKSAGEIEKLNTQSLLAALYTHETSRAQDPHLHTHSLIINATQRMDGQWRSVESKPIYSAQKKLGLIYRMSLAKELQLQGKQIVVTGNDATFELKDIPTDFVKKMSKRSNQIEEKLSEKGLDRRNATASQKEIINLDTRENKERVTRKSLRRGWLEEAKEYKYQPAQVANDSNSNDVNRLKDSVFTSVIESVQAFKSRFTEADLEEKLSLYGLGIITFEEMKAQIKESPDLIQTETKAYSKEKQSFELVPGYTTKVAQKTEKSIIRSEWRGRGEFNGYYSDSKAVKIVKSAEKISNDKGFNWTDSQKKATHQLLVNGDIIVGIQGYAGTAKTNTVIATFASAMQAKGYRVIGMAPTSSAANTLESAGIESPSTIHSFLAQEEKITGKEVWIVDEASLVGSKLMEKLLQKAEEMKTKVVLVGDTKQHQSVEYGSSFQQLQDAGMTTYNLTEIVRQKTEKARQKVYDVIEDRMPSVLNKLGEEGKLIIDGSDQNRMETIAEKYTNLDEKSRLNTLVIDPSIEGKDKLTELIQNKLVAKNNLTNGVDTTYLSEKKKINHKDDGIGFNISETDKKFAFSYQVNDWVVFNKNHKRRGIEKGEYYQVVSSDNHSGAVTLKDSEGKKTKFEPGIWGKDNKIYEEKKVTLHEGDQVTITKNLGQGIHNGLSGRITKTSEGHVILETKKGQHRINFDDLNSKHFSLNYVNTTYRAQGDTKKNTMYHLDSSRVNLTNKAAFYVGLSRATEQTIVVTDDKDKALKALRQNDGSNETSMNKQDLLKFNKELENSIQKDMNKSRKQENTLAKTINRRENNPALSL